ncbi:dynamin family protein [Streptomyces uncialis]|uniref:dynamin family protein n=1 Tax=Streptomyces uncialis TaxID=1048205 RepID=UPI0037F49E73
MSSPSDRPDAADRSHGTEAPDAPGEQPGSDERATRIVRSIVDMARIHKTGESVWGPLENLADRWREPFARAAVVGEVSVGKSTLVNALVGQDVLPAATEALSAVTVELRHGPRTRATVGLHDGTDAVTRELTEREQLLVYLTTRGEKQVTIRHGRDTQVLWAVVALPSPLLKEGLRLTDTPGVGGLDPAHRRQTLAALSNTDAVLFVILPGEPISASELRFLAESVHRVSSYVIVQTHRDQTSDAQVHLDKNLAVLRDPATWRKLLGDGADAEDTAARFARVPGVCVAAQHALDALDAAPGQERDRDMRFSGIPELTRLLREEVIDRAGELHRRDLLRLAESTAAAVRTGLVERKALLSPGEAAERAIQEREENVRRWVGKDGDTWKPDLEAATAFVQDEIREIARERVKLLERTYLVRFPSMKTQKLQEAATRLVIEPPTVLAEMRERITERLNDAVARIGARNPQDAVSTHLERLALTDGLDAHLPASFRQSETMLNDEYLTSVAMTGIPLIARQFADARRKADEEKRGTVVRRTDHSSVARTTMEFLSAAAKNPGVTAAVVAASLFAGLVAWRQRKAKTLAAVSELYVKVTGLISKEAVDHSVAQAARERDAIIEVIEARLKEEGERIERDRDDLARLTDLTARERAALLNETDLALREVDSLVAELAGIRTGWGL